MPVFNRESLVGEAIKSYLNQTKENFELVVVDDGSTDRTYEVCEQLARQDKRIKLFCMKKNGGVARARHYGNTRASGDVIVVADSDDLAYKNRLEILHDLYDKNPEAAVCYTNLDVYSTETGETKRRFFQPYVKELLYHINFVPNASSSYKKEAYFSCQGYASNLRISEDYDLWLQFADKNMVFASSPISTVKMLKHSGSIRVEKQNEHKNFIELVRKRHNISSPSLKIVRDLANKETYEFFSEKNKALLWFGQ